MNLFVTITKVISMAVCTWFLSIMKYVVLLHDFGDSIQSVELLNVSEKPATMYKAYLKDFGKVYEGDELKKRFAIFKRNLKEIPQSNTESGAKFGLTKFTDMTPDELPIGLPNEHCSEQFYRCDGGSEIEKLDFHRHKMPPLKFDWRDEHFVGPVLDQKRCNGCWAFGIVGAMETQAAILNHTYGLQLSIQELLDCSGHAGNCENGNVALALKELCNNERGVITEKEYPLKLVTQKCHKNLIRHNHGLKIRRFWKRCNMTNEDDIVRLVAFHGPVLVVVNADPWKSYVGGIIQDNCVRIYNNTRDHVVQIVGYNKDPDSKEIPHFIIRNSYGENFGEEGYVRLAMNKNMCGLAEEIVVLDVMD